MFGVNDFALLICELHYTHQATRIYLHPVPQLPFPVFCELVSPHPACSLREQADLPAWRGGEIRLQAYPHSLFPVLFRLGSPHPACSLREPADLPAWRGGEIRLRAAPDASDRPLRDTRQAYPARDSKPVATDASAPRRTAEIGRAH